MDSAHLQGQSFGYATQENIGYPYVIRCNSLGGRSGQNAKIFGWELHNS